MPSLTFSPPGALGQITVLAGSVSYLTVIHSGPTHSPRAPILDQALSYTGITLDPVLMVLSAQPSTFLKNPASPSVGKCQWKSVIGGAETWRESSVQDLGLLDSLDSLGREERMANILWLLEGVNRRGIMVNLVPPTNSFITPSFQWPRQLHNLQAPMQNENAGPFLQKLFKISRGQQQSIRPSMGPF